MAQMDADGYKWMRMGAIGCMGKGSTQNNTDRAKCECMGVFDMHDNNAKTK